MNFQSFQKEPWTLRRRQGRRRQAVGFLCCWHFLQVGHLVLLVVVSEWLRLAGFADFAFPVGVVPHFPPLLESEHPLLRLEVW